MIQYPKPSKYLLDMPKHVLNGPAKKIERWLSDNRKARPTLLDLEAARRARRK